MHPNKKMAQTNVNWTFLHVNDSHMGTPRSFRFRPAINRRWAAIKRQIAAIDAEFLLHGGDLTRDGDIHEFEYQCRRARIWTRCPFPHSPFPATWMWATNTPRQRSQAQVGALGVAWNDPDLNVTAQRLDLFSSYFGPICWTFLYREIRFTGFFAAVAGSGLPHENDSGGCSNGCPICRRRAITWP
jgi:hypothetical protein